MTGDIVVSVQNLSVIKGNKEILNVPSLSVQKGEFIAVTGPNGAGKSTLLQALCLLEPAAGGEIIFNGRAVRGANEILRVRRRMAMVFQDPLLLRGTVLDNVTIGLKLRGVPKETRRKKAGYWLNKLSIAHLANRDVRTLSGGEAQRVSLARAMALEPDVLFLDEPFTYLDTPTRAALAGELKEILGETGTTTLMVTHDLSDIPYLADRLIVMMEGRIRQFGPVEQVLSHPVGREVAEFLGVENIWDGYLTGNDTGHCRFFMPEMGASLVLAPVHRKTGGPENVPAVACLRPEHVMVACRDGSGLSAGSPAGNGKTNVFNGRVEAVYPYGYHYRLKIKAGFVLTALAPAVNFPRAPKHGDSVWVFLPPEKIHVMAAPEDDCRPVSKFIGQEQEKA